MDKLPKDVVELITNELSPREFFNYCKSETGQKFCARKDIWLRRIQKDFGFLLEGRNKDRILVNYATDPKESYLELFLKTSRTAEYIKEKVLEHIGEDFQQFLKEDYKDKLYNFLFQYSLKMINSLNMSDISGKINENLHYLTGEYVWENEDYLKYLPQMYSSDVKHFWNEEIQFVLERYAIEIFNL